MLCIQVGKALQIAAHPWEVGKLLGPLGLTLKLSFNPPLGRSNHLGEEVTEMEGDFISMVWALVC